MCEFQIVYSDEHLPGTGFAGRRCASSRGSTLTCGRMAKRTVSTHCTRRVLSTADIMGWCVSSTLSSGVSR